jgi:anti-sigma factor ChrR (cupin superfamily)
MATKTAEVKPRVPKMKATPGGSTYVRPGEMEWSPTQFDKVWIKVLYEDKAKGEMTCLVKLEPGAYLPMHIHPEIEQALVLEGSMTDHDGTAYAGDYVWRRPGSTHDNHSEDGAVVFAVYRKPNIFQHSSGLKASRRPG